MFSYVIFLASDIIPKFTKHPLSTSSNTTGGPLEISGCEIQSRIPLDKNDQIFYLINNVKNHPARFIQKTKKVDGVNIRYYSIIPYTKNTTSYEDQGFYQCGITINGLSPQTILSKTTDVQFSGLEFVSILTFCLETVNVIKMSKHIKSYFVK